MLNDTTACSWCGSTVIAPAQVKVKLRHGRIALFDTTDCYHHHADLYPELYRRVPGGWGWLDGANRQKVSAR